MQKDGRTFQESISTARNEGETVGTHQAHMINNISEWRRGKNLSNMFSF